METEEQLKKERDKIVKGLEETYRRLIEYKKLKKSPMIVMRDGKIEAVDPHEMLPTILYKRNGGYYGSVCATRFGVTVPPVPVQTVPGF